jgi:hypothetical protein
MNDHTGIATVHLLFQGLYRDIGDYKQSLTYAFAGERIAEANNVIGKFWFPAITSHLYSWLRSVKPTY